MQGALRHSRVCLSTLYRAASSLVRAPRSDTRWIPLSAIHVYARA
jgi:hypothetical protein